MCNSLDDFIKNIDDSLSENNDLPTLREGIDSLDKAMITLLEKRMDLTRRVGEVKERDVKSQDKAFIRPGREATLIRNLVNNTTLSPALVAALWRLILSACVNDESPLTVGVFGPKKEAIFRAYDVYGRFTTSTAYADFSDLLSAIRNKEITVGLLPVTPNTWWQSYPAVNESQPVAIFAQYPFVKDEGFAALSCANIELEPSGDDASLFRVRLKPEVTFDALDAVVKKAGLRVNVYESQDRDYFLSISEFHTQIDLKLKEEIKNNYVDTIDFLGSIATPISET